MDVSVQETPDQVVITECTDKFSIKIVDKLFTNVQSKIFHFLNNDVAFTPTFDLSPIGVRRCEAVLHTPTSGLLGYTSSNSSVTLTQFDISTGSFNIVKRTKITNVYSSDCDGLLKPHIFNDTMYVTSSVCDITERGNLKIFLVRMHGTTVCVMEHPSVLSTLPLMIAPFPRGNFPNGARNENYLLVASKHGLVSKLKYTDDGLTVSVVGAYKLPNPLLAGEGDPVRSRIYFKDTTNTVMELDVMTLNLVTKNVIPNNMIVKACVTSAKHGRITMVVMDTGTGDYRLVNYDVVNMAEIATTDAIPALRDAEGISSFILDDDEVNGYFIRSCSQGKTLVHIYLPDLQVKATYLWDTDFVAVAQNPVISGNYLFYSTSHLAQTTEYLRFDLKTTPNFTTQTALAPFRYIPRVMTLDPSQPNVVYVAMDSVVKQMSISSSSWFEKGREMRFSELDYAPGGVFTSSVIDRQNNLLFLASSNGLVFTVNINEETTMAFKIGMGCAGAALGAFVLMLISLLIARNAYRLRRLKNRESEMERLLEERLLVDDETTSCEPQHSWIIDYSELQIDDRISEGTFGVIFKGRLRGMVVAIKKLKADGDEDAFHQEAKILASLRHPNTVLFMGISLTTNYNFMVTEFCSGGSLEDFIHKKKRLRKPISFKKKVKLLFGVVNGMMYLHNMKNPQNPLESKPLIHRDLKPSNILLDDTRTVAKVCDFGASKILSANATMTGRIGTILYMSPEVLMNQRYTESCDVYSFGIIMHEIFYERVPYSTPQSSINGSNTSSTSSEGSSAEFANLWTLGLQISQGLRPFVPEENSKEFMAYSKHQQHYLRVMQLCWDSVPSNRPTFCDLADVFAKWM
jgi:tRNA A-37 threonylcarbamoyl transferase component Bud32